MRILHTMLRVGDLDKSLAFYTEVLGMRLLRRSDFLWQARFVWDNVNAHWNDWVVKFSGERQARMLEGLGFGATDWKHLAMMLGGYASEFVYFGDLTTGASDDLKRATKLAHDMVTRYGMSEALGARTYGDPSDEIFLGRDYHVQRNYSDKTAEEIDREVKRLVEEAKETAREILTKNRDKIEVIVAELLLKETIEKERFEELPDVDGICYRCESSTGGARCADIGLKTDCSACSDSKTCEFMELTVYLANGEKFEQSCYNCG